MTNADRYNLSPDSLERAQRINRTLDLLDPAVRDRSALRPVEILVIAPSQRHSRFPTPRHSLCTCPRPSRSSSHSCCRRMFSSGYGKGVRAALPTGAFARFFQHKRQKIGPGSPRSGG